MGFRCQFRRRYPDPLRTDFTDKYRQSTVISQQVNLIVLASCRQKWVKLQHLPRASN
jgi:hypothetical protein